MRDPSLARAASARVAAHEPDADWPLVEQVRRREAAGFEALYARYQAPISRLVANIIRQPDAVPDLVQEIFTKVYFALDGFTPGLPFKPWLYRLASNHCIDFLRKRRRQPRLAEPPADAGEGWEWELPDQSHPDALSSLISRDLAAKLLNQLKPRDRMLLVMQDLQGLSLEEMIAITGLRLSAVKVGLFRARKRLLAAYQKVGAGAGSGRRASAPAEESPGGPLP